MNNEYQTSVVAELTDGIILSEYKSRFDYTLREGSQSEQDLENEFIEDLVKQGYQFKAIKNDKELLLNLKEQLEILNKTSFKTEEWNRFLEEYLNPASDGKKEKAKKIHESYVYDFIFDDGHIENIKIIDKKDVTKNIVQVMQQYKNGKNRYDVTILVNGLPLVHVELKRRGISLEEAFNQIHRYGKDSFNDENSLFKYVQIFVISNGTYTRYFSNTISRDKNNFDYTCEWSDAKNNSIKDLKDFTATFFVKNIMLEILTKYCVFTADEELLIMRPYQIAATERIIWKINSSYNNKKWNSTEAGGYIWHTTGSGKTLTSFKTARLATELEYIDKVFFIVDRKDLDYQTMKEYQKFQKNSVSGSNNTKALTSAIESENDKIIVTTIQKLNNFISQNETHEIYAKHCVMIFDECHRSQFGIYQQNIKRKFKKNYQFGFTGTPIFEKNAKEINQEKLTTEKAFGLPLHSYVITHAIRDEKVLKFKVDYEKTIPNFYNEGKVENLDSNLLHHKERISAVTEHILKVFNEKTRRGKNYVYNKNNLNTFNAMFAVDKIDTAMNYYREFQEQQKVIDEDKRLKIATIFSVAPNEELGFNGEIEEENFEPIGLEPTKKQFLEKAIEDYNNQFRTNFTIEGQEFNNYYKDLSQRIKNCEIDLVIVVGMFLTGFDAPRLNTLFVDKNLQYHGLIQAFSRTNRILNKVKPYGNIVCYRDLDANVKEAISLFADEEANKIILEKSFEDYMNGFKDEIKGETIRGFISISEELLEKFSTPANIVLEQDKIDFCKLFGQFLKLENKLKNYDEFNKISETDKIITSSLKQDMQSAYVTMREEFKKKKESDEYIADNTYDEIEFQIELLKTEEINLDFILALIMEKSKEKQSKEVILEEIKRTIRASIDLREKEDLIIKYLNNFEYTEYSTFEELLDSFYKYAKGKKEKDINKLIEEEKLKGSAKSFIEKSIAKNNVSDVGTELNDILPPMSRRAGDKESKKRETLYKIDKMVKKYVGI